MRVVIDCFKQVKGAGKSIGIYNVAISIVRNLAAEQRRTADADIKNCEIIVLGNRFNRPDFDMEGIRFVQVTGYDPLNKIHCVLWELFGVSSVCKKMKADRVFFPRGYCAVTHPVHDIVMIHDLIPFFYHENFPGVFNRLENAYIMKRLKASAETSKRIITISNASRDEILKYCRVEKEKISVIYNACNVVEYSKRKEPQCKPYICALTSPLPHKNAKGIVRAYSCYYAKAENPLDLLIIGIDSTAGFQIDDEAIDHIRCEKYIKSNEEMYRLIHNSVMFLFLSLVEGFGLPPIEAMQLEVPVICSERSSLPEVVGDAALLVDPENAEEIAEAIEKLQCDPQLQERLAAKGKSNMERFAQDSRAKLYWDAILWG